MYVYFGFSLTRLRRARTIDLQCQSLSPGRGFLLRSVCLSTRLTVLSYGVRWPARLQNHPKIITKIDPRGSPGTPKIDSKSLPGPSRDTPCRPRASRRRLGSVSGASRSVPGTSQERQEGPKGRPGTPERAPGSARERAEATTIDAKSRPGAKKSSFVRAARSRTLFGTIF